MKWRKLTDYTEEDESGDFRITRSEIASAQGHETNYTIWHRTELPAAVPGGKPSVRWEPVALQEGPLVAKMFCAILRRDCTSRAA